MLVFPAKQMRVRALDFTQGISRDYVDSGSPFPVYTILYRSGLLPDTVESMQAIGRCGDLVPKDGAFRFSRAPVADLTLPYHALLADQTLRNEITLPKDLVIRYDAVAADQSKSFTFEPAIAVRQVDRLKVNGIVAPIPERLLLSRIRISGTGLRYELTTPDGSGAYGILLDFSADTGDTKIRYEASRTPSRRTGVRFGLLMLFALLGLNSAGCINHTDHSGDPPQAVQNLEVCFSQPAPDGFVRIDSKAAGLAGCPSPDDTSLNVFVYANYLSKASGTKLLVCADAPVPAGWIDVSSSYHDEKGCDAARYHGTRYDNVRLIYHP